MKLIYLSLFFSFLSLVGQAQSYELMEAQQAFQNKQYQRAITIAKTLLQRDSLNLNAYRLLASSYLATRQPILAEQAVADGQQHFSKTTSLQWIKAEALLQRGILDRALPIYRQLLKADVSVPKDEIRQRLGLIYQSRGGKYYRQKKFVLAEKNLKKAKQFMPDTLASYSNLALVYMRQERWEKALEIIDDARKRFPGDANLMRMRASALFQTKNYEGVLDEYEKLYNKKPNALDTALPYAQLLLARGHRKKAAEIYEQLLKNHPGDKKIYESLINFYEQRRNMQAKRAVLQKMRKQFPGDASLMRRIAVTYENQDKWDEARAAYDTLQTMEGASVSLATSVAQTYIAQDSLIAADYVYVRALKEFTGDETLLRLRGEVQQEMKQWKAAEETYRHLTLVSDSSDGYAALAKVQLELDKKNKALLNFEKSIDRNTRDGEVYLQSAKLYLQKNRTEKAFQYGERALHLALMQVQELQQVLTQKLQGNKNLFALEGTEAKAKELERNNRLAVQSFDFIKNTFSQDRVLPLVHSLQEEYPNSGRLLFMISSYYLDIGIKKQGVALLKDATRLSPNLAEAHIALGRHHENSQQIIKAIQSYERALSADSEGEKSYKALIRLYRDADKLDQLCNRWRARLRANPENSTLKRYLIEALHKADRFEEAQQIIDGRL